MTYLCSVIFFFASRKAAQPALAAASQNLVLGMALMSLLFGPCHSSGIFFPKMSRTRGKVLVHIDHVCEQSSQSFTQSFSRGDAESIPHFSCCFGVCAQLFFTRLELWVRFAVSLVSVTVLGLFISMWTITDKIGTDSTRNAGIWAGSQQPYSWRNLPVHLRLRV